MATAPPPDLLALMNAYKVLGVDYSADSAAIRQAHKRLAKQHHPDRFPIGSAEQHQATGDMAAINDAYALIRKAPLRSYRVSKPPESTTTPSESDFDDAIDRGRRNQKVDRWMMEVENLDRWMTLALVALLIAVPAFTSSVAVFKARAHQAVRVSQAALRPSGSLTGMPATASSKKISAQELESQLRQSSSVPDPTLRCEATTVGWDYICAYTPTDRTLFPRLHFGVNVDSKRVLEISRTVPFGVPIPPLGL